MDFLRFLIAGALLSLTFSLAVVVVGAIFYRAISGPLPPRVAPPDLPCRCHPRKPFSAEDSPRKPPTS